MSEICNDTYQYEHMVEIDPGGRRVWKTILFVNGTPVARATGATVTTAERSAREAYERCYVPCLGRPRRIGA